MFVSTRFIDYEMLTGLKLRPIFKSLDTRRKGYIVLEDFEVAFPQVWAKYGTEAKLLCRLGFPDGHPQQRQEVGRVAETPRGAEGARVQSSPATGSHVAPQQLSPDGKKQAFELILAAMERGEADRQASGSMA
eukprot:1389367-Amphidinium_carterae.1